METVCFRLFSLSREIQVKRNIEEFLKTGIRFFSSQQCNYSKRDLVLHVKGYHSKFARWKTKITNIHQVEKCSIAQRNDGI